MSDATDIIVPQKCRHCGGRLGAQDPGDVCGHCKNLPPAPPPPRRVIPGAMGATEDAT